VENIRKVARATLLRLLVELPSMEVVLGDHVSLKPYWSRGNRQKKRPLIPQTRRLAAGTGAATPIFLLVKSAITHFFRLRHKRAKQSLRRSFCLRKQRFLPMETACFFSHSCNTVLFPMKNLPPIAFFLSKMRYSRRDEMGKAHRQEGPSQNDRFID